jgi:hypothetical protein
LAALASGLKYSVPFAIVVQASSARAIGMTMAAKASNHTLLSCLTVFAFRSRI